MVRFRGRGGGSSEDWDGWDGAVRDRGDGVREFGWRINLEDTPPRAARFHRMSNEKSV